MLAEHPQDGGSPAEVRALIAARVERVLAAESGVYSPEQGRQALQLVENAAQRFWEPGPLLPGVAIIGLLWAIPELQEAYRFTAQSGALPLSMRRMVARSRGPGAELTFCD
jgi:hypothetical protein